MITRNHIKADILLCLFSILVLLATGSYDTYAQSTPLPPVIENNVIVNNQAEKGGGVAGYNSAAVIRDNLIIENTATAELGGGAIYSAGAGAYPRITGNTISQNSAPSSQGGGISISEGQAWISNDILWQNQGDLKKCSATYSDVTNLATSPGTGNISVDPLFLQTVNPDAVDYYRINESSPCVDKGDPAVQPIAGETDINGNSRIVGGRIDMGAHEVLDSTGPVISDVKFSGTTLVNDMVLRTSGTFTLNATDRSGMSKVEFFIDGSILCTDYNPPYECLWDIYATADGPHTLAIMASDTLGNSAQVTYAIIIALNPPAAPSITQPQTGLITNQQTITVKGQADKYTEIILYNNSAQAAGPKAVDSSGGFSMALGLVSGQNRIQAAAQNRAGQSPLSGAVIVTLDTAIPAAPTNLLAVSKEGGVVRLSWRASTTASIKGYNLYRAMSSFTTIGGATKVNTTPITGLTYDDLPPSDGQYFYRVTALSQANTESELSGEVFASSDRTMPKAGSIAYTPQGAYDPKTGRMAPGAVEVRLTVTEPLQSVPFLSITPHNGAPISIELIKVSDTVYTGIFVITPTTPSGTAYAVFSGRDLVGNRGTEIEQGGSIQIDTDGPSVYSLALSPSDPIKNNQGNPVKVTVVIGLTEKMRPGVTPALSFLLSGPGRNPTPIEGLVEATPPSGEAQAWRGHFTLPADAGLAAAEAMTFLYEGEDDLGNLSDQILCTNLFQVYQNELPPLGVPDGLTGKSLPGGKIQLTWNPVQDAVDYQLFRQGPGETGLAAYQRTGDVEEYLDTPTQDGSYTYAIASIRKENNQEAISGLSAAVVVVSDRTATAAPQGLVLTLIPQGIKAAWQPPEQLTEQVTYTLYRADLPEITSVEGLVPLAAGILQTMVIDPHPSPTDHSYVVTAVDRAGNESAPSNSFYLNFTLLPVSTISVKQQGTNPPMISWTHPGGDIAGYDIYLGPEGKRVKLNSTLLTAKSYIDTGYATDERLYSVIAVDSHGVESLARSVLLPVLKATLVDTPPQVKRGIMNRLEYKVESRSSIEISNIRLKVKIGNRDHVSESFSLQPLTSLLIPVIVGGYSDLPDIAPIVTIIESTPNPGEKVEIERSADITVGDGMLVVQISNEEFIRGGTGTVWFVLENTGEEEIEILTARNSGTQPSDQVVYKLLNKDGNVLATQFFKQALGQGIVTLANTNTVARISATNKTFTSGKIQIPVPANAPDDVIVKLSISAIYYHQGRPDQVLMEGLSTTRTIALVATTYYGEITSITPESSTGDRPIVIRGRAIERSSGAPMASVTLDLIITVGGFERTSKVVTDTNGEFTYTFVPLAGESGVYYVRAMHPDLLDKPVHGQFVISRVAISPTTINLSIPYNYDKAISVKATTGEGTEAHNLRLVYEAKDQPQGIFPQGIHLTIGNPVAYLGPGRSADLGFSVWADNTAAGTGALVLMVTSDENTWAKVVVNTHFSAALPVLQFTPDHIETGVAHGKAITETITLKNAGLATMDDVALALIMPNGAPAPAWVYLTTAAQIGAIPVGEARQVGIAFAPSSSVAEGVYSFKLRVTSGNYPQTDINLYCSVTQSGIGNVIFKVTDIYTGTLDKNNQVIQGLANAKVYLQNEAVLTVERTVYTDSYGEASISDLAAGVYKCRVTATNHQEYIGRFWIKPGITVNNEVFLNYNLVTVEWEVNEITIEDRYEIILKVTYETDVPAAVVVAEPPSTNLPAMKAGDVYNGEFALTNYGLIRADNLAFTLPQTDQFFRYELLGGLPKTLDAKQRVIIPFRVTCIQSPIQQGGGTGGGCERYASCITIGYEWVCMNGQWTWAAVKKCFFYDNGECTSSDREPPAMGGGGTGNVGGGGEGGGTSSTAPASTEIQGAPCLPKPERKECHEDPCARQEETQENIVYNVGSSVNLVMREYTRDQVDLAIKVPGGAVQVQRWYYDNQWSWEHTRNNLKFTWDALGKTIESIDKGGVIYNVSSTDAKVFIHDDIYRITVLSNGYRWQSKQGEWKEFDAKGRMTSYGTRAGIIGTLLYEPGETGRLIGVADKNDTQVIWYEYNAEGLISAVRDADNHRVEYSYTYDKLTKVKDVLGNETFYQYDSKGRISKVIDARGNATNITYDNYGSVASVTDKDGVGTFFEFAYDEGKKEFYARIKTSAGMIKEVWYDKDGETKQVQVNGRSIKKIAKDGRNLIITDEKGNVSTKYYDEWDNLNKVVYPDGATVTTEYDLRFNRPSRVIDERGVITEYAYDTSGNLIRKVEAKGTAMERVTEYTYDANGNQLTVKVLGDANTAEALTVMEYDASGNMTSIKDPEGNITRFTTYDNLGNLLIRVDARGKTWTYTYDDAGRPKTTTDPLNNVTQFFYDEKGNKIRELDAENHETTFQYDHKNRLIKTTNVLGNKTLFEYNTDGKLIKQTDPEGKVVRYEYDNRGRLVKAIDGNGNEIAVQYDNASDTGCTSCSGSSGANQPSKIIYPTFTQDFAYDVRGRKTVERDVLSDTETYVTSFAYDLSGNLASQTDKENKTTIYEYDGLRRLKKVIDPLNQRIEYTYDDRDNLLALKDAKGNVTRFEYDRNNRLIREIRPMLQEIYYAYDETGNLKQKTDSKNQKTEYGYDDADRLKEVRYITTPAKTVTFTYDRMGNLKSYNDGITSASYGYDNNYRKTLETLNLGNFELSYSYTYYGNGLKKTFTGPDNVAYTYAYDANNQLTSIQIPNQGSITYTSYTWNQPASITLPGGSKKDYIYDPLMRIKEITAKDPAQNVLMNYQYTYDKMDNIKTKGTEHGNYQYSYDDLYRLTSADNPVQNDEAYTYDNVGNRLTSASTTAQWQYNANNELQSYNGTSYQYDANGNIISKTDQAGTTTYTYDVDNRLIKVRNPQSEIYNYYYDPFGKRLWKDVGGTKTYFLYVDEGLIGEYDVSGSQTKAYGYMPDSTWTTDPLFVKEGGNYYFYHNDHLDTSQKITAINGAVVWAAKYTAFGEAAIEIETVKSNLRFPGQYFDEETGLHYNYFRYYDPRSGRYISADSIGIQRGANHLYVYIKNNPIKFIDPFGLYNSPVHLIMTWAHALAAGYSLCAADEIADADQRVDDNPKTSSFNREGCKLYHFTTPERRQELLNQAYSSCNSSDLGIALHALQDSYSHIGYRCPFGHAKDTAKKNDPDDHTKDMAKTNRMLRATDNVLKDFLERCRSEATKCCKK